MLSRPRVTPQPPGLTPSLALIALGLLLVPVQRG